MALRLAEQLDQVSGGGELPVLETLAAAFAENGNFESAVAAIERALRLLEREGSVSPEARRQLEQRREQYRSGRPTRQ